MASLFEGHPLAMQHLTPNLLRLYVDIEFTGSHNAVCLPALLAPAFLFLLSWFYSFPLRLSPVLLMFLSSSCFYCPVSRRVLLCLYVAIEFTASKSVVRLRARSLFFLFVTISLTGSSWFFQIFT